MQDLCFCVALANITSESQVELLVRALVVVTRMKRRRTSQYNEKRNVVWYVQFHVFQLLIYLILYEQSCC